MSSSKRSAELLEESENGVVNGALNGAAVVSDPKRSKVDVSQAVLGDAVDPWCDEENPKTIHFQDVSEAAFKLRGGIERTPSLRSTWLSEATGVDLYFKKDFLQNTGSFKERGARFSLLKLTEKERRQGVVAASAGNHALALAYHGHKLNVPVTVVMPTIAPMMKVGRCKAFGAEVVIHGNDMAATKQYAINLARDRNMLYINGYDHPHILAGQGTIALEIIEDVPDVDAVIIPVGGGGLIAGCAVAIKYLQPNCLVIGAESEKCPGFKKAMEAGRPIPVHTEWTLADGLAVPKVGYNAFATAHKLIDKMVTVDEGLIALAILRLIEQEKCVCEGAGAISLAALLNDEYLPELKGKKVVALLCGGNIDTTVLGRCLERGLAADGRLARFVVTVSDRPGGIAELTALCAKLGASIKDIFHERAWMKTDIFSVRVKVIVETRDADHCKELEAALNKNYKDVVFQADV